MFTLQVGQLDSSTRQNSLYFESTFVRLASGHYFRAKDQLHPDRGTTNHRTIFSEPPQAPKLASKHANESGAAYGPRIEHQFFAVRSGQLPHPHRKSDASWFVPGDSRAPYHKGRLSSADGCGWYRSCRGRASRRSDN